MALDPPTWFLAELGPVPEQPAERDAWITAAVELDTWRRTHGLDDERPAQQGRGQRTRPERPGRPVDRLRSKPATRPDRAAASEQPAEAQPRTSIESRRHGPRWHHPTGDRAEQARDAPVAELLGAEPGRREPGRRRDWQQVRAALDRLAAHREHTRDPDHHRASRDERDRDPRRPERTPAPHERAER
jgi:hypothetical protein